MTYDEAITLLIGKEEYCIEALECMKHYRLGNKELAEKRTAKLIRRALWDSESVFTDTERDELSALAESVAPPDKTKSKYIGIRVSENEFAAIKILAVKYAGGNMTKLIIDALERQYPTV